MSDQNSSASQRLRWAMAAEGIITHEPLVADGRLHRVHVVDDRPGRRNGWYVLHADSRPAGAFGSWRLGVFKTWRDEQPPHPGMGGGPASPSRSDVWGEQRGEGRLVVPLCDADGCP